MDNVIETKEYNGVRLRIFQDEVGDCNPREWDNLGTIICFHNDYVLGDKNDISKSNFNSWNELGDFLIEEKKAVVIFPIRIYEHSGISISITNEYPYNDRWDSGQIGFIYCDRETILKEYNIKSITQKTIEKVKECLRAEIETYNQYLTGEVFGYVLDKKVICDKCSNIEYEHIDSCWGYYGNDFKKNGLSDNITDYEKFINKEEVVEQI